MARVIATGLGIICCLGRGKSQVWSGLVNGESRFSSVTLPDFDRFAINLAGQVPDDLLETSDPSPPRGISRFELLGWLAALEAIEDAGLTAAGYAPDTIGVQAGIGAAGMLESESWLQARSKAKRPSPKALFGYPVSSLSALLAEHFGWLGPRISIATACSSSAASLGLAAEAIRHGRVAAAVIVGSEALSRLTYGGFHSLRSMAPDTCRPFDARRQGLILGEGAGAVVLENKAAAEARGAPNYGELLGWGWSADAHHMTAPHPEGKGAGRAMHTALERSGLQPAQIEYINMHGTGTVQNDSAETQAVKSVFGRHAEHLKLSSTKSMTGHCLGAAGIIESVSTLLTLETKVLPPTANLEQPGADCDLDYVPRQAEPCKGLRRAMNNVMAFGGNNVALIFQNGRNGTD